MIKVFFLFFLSFSIYSQEIRIESKMEYETTFEKDLKSFENIQYYNFDFVSDQENSLHFQIIEKEFIKGKLKEDKVYFDSKVLPKPLISSKIPVSLFSKYTQKDNYKTMMRFYNGITMIRNFELLEKEQFSFKIFVNISQKFQKDTTYLFWGIIKPIKVDENTFRDCDFNSSLDKYEQWYEVFGLDHYYIYEIKFY